MAGATVTMAAFEFGCGDRTALPLLQPCNTPGQTRGCSNDCGPGTEVCENGYWSSTCAVPPTFRSCSNTCGTGTQECVEDAWLDCSVRVAQRPCSNTCGTGEQECVNDAWLDCKVPLAQRPCSSVCGKGAETCTNDAWGACDAPPPGPPTLQGLIRNFQWMTQPDFAPCAPACYGIPLDLGIVSPTLGSDDEPVYAGDPTTPTTHGATYFNEWYHDTPGVTEPIPAHPFTLSFMAATDGSASFVYDNEYFFPVDNLFFGNQGMDHNYWFTLEVHSQVLYTGGETYSLTSDDDSWLFINHQLAINLGGVHAAQGQSVMLDEIAGQLGIVKGQTYPLDLFYADREPVSAVLTLSIPMADIWSCP